MGSPPMTRLTMIGLAVPPEPAIAPSTQLWPVALNALANSVTAAASPRLVQQCITSSSVALAALAPTNAVMPSRLLRKSSYSFSLSIPDDGIAVI